MTDLKETGTMFSVAEESMSWGGQVLRLETGKFARQAGGAVLVTYGETQVLCTATAQATAKAGIDFMPLTVNYQEKTFAAGRIPGGFFKREGRPSEKETLTSRLIDRPLRPLFPSGYFHETQIVCTVLSHDKLNNPDVPALIGGSAALALSGIPFLGPVGAARVGYADGAFALNTEGTDSQLNLVVAGTKEGVLMVESMAHELSEQIMLDAVMFGFESFQAVLEMIESLSARAGKERWAMPEKPVLDKELRRAGEGVLREAYGIVSKVERSARLEEVRSELSARFVDEEDEGSSARVSKQIKELEKDIVRSGVLSGGSRIDGRGLAEVRSIECEAGLLCRAHGSALFTRGETQALSVSTLGTGQDEQIIDALEGEYRERFLLHYNFPPFSVGEAQPLRPPGRREVGHGKLAWRALLPLLPDAETFPYTVRVVSEVTESNGSSSMATVCASSLSLMDCGVPLVRPCAGIAMGLIKEGEKFAVLSDILGDEDHLGDMDFKVAGTAFGVTALQMDIKITSITREIMAVALEQAREGRLHILGVMGRALSSARDELSLYAPRVLGMRIPSEKIRDVIGTGGKIIREICETTGSKIDIEDDGGVRIYAEDGASALRAQEWIISLTAEPEEGVIYRGKVVKITDFGAFVNFFGSRDGLVHISEIADRRIGSVAEVLREGEEVYVKCLGSDDRGKIRLSMRVVDQQTGEGLALEPRPMRSGPPRGGERDYRDKFPRRDRGDRGDRGDRPPRRAMR